MNGWEHGKKNQYDRVLKVVSKIRYGYLADAYVYVCIVFGRHWVCIIIRVSM